ncbi:MAG: CRISPR-associated endonuclease Cas1 [Candidatus Marinimicrobia bacterium]|nr:CRISPR-associated endonuclease Cas1 [Candidatus Neomarinimicrobiota bacterium]MCH8068610.1 CRISPR-associated endonuclease Cas1 [Candidatus Neomarinimicrobiota bacterium]
MLYIGTNGQKKPIPIEDVEAIYCLGEKEFNTKLITFLSQKQVPPIDRKGGIQRKWRKSFNRNNVELSQQPVRLV